MENGNWDRLIENLKKEGVLRSPKVVQALRSVPRTKFLPEEMQSYSAVDTPLPVGSGQTISAPHSHGSQAELGETW